MTLRWSKEELDEYNRKRGKAAPKSSAPKTPKPPKERDAPASRIEALFDDQIRRAGFPAPAHNYLFHPTRNWELDRAWSDRKIAVEIDGHVHRIRGRFEGDIEKHAEALLLGWRVLRVSGKSIRSGLAIIWLATLLE